MAPRRSSGRARAVRRAAGRDEQPVHALRGPARRRSSTRSSPTLETGDAATVAETLPEGAAALIEIAEDTRRGPRACRPRHATAGVVLDTFANVLQEPAGAAPRSRSKVARRFRRTTSSRSSREPRGHRRATSTCRRGVALEQPIVIRWAAGAARPGPRFADADRHRARTPARACSRSRCPIDVAASRPNRTRRACGGARPRSGSPAARASTSPGSRTSARTRSRS